jgi:hypothetical protein
VTPAWRVLGACPPRRVDVRRLARPRTRLEDLDHRIAVLETAELLERGLAWERQRKRLARVGVSV